MQLFQGTFVHSPKLGELEILKDHLVAVNESGVVAHFEPFNTPRSLALLSNASPSSITTIPQGSFLLPTFCDLHLHAPQFLYQGNGLDLPLMQWLDRYALKAEASLDMNPSLAQRVYTRLAQRLKENGTGTVLLFGTIKEETNIILARCMRSAGVRAFVGKLSMDIDISSPAAKNPIYVEPSASASLDAARSFIERCYRLAEEGHSDKDGAEIRVKGDEGDGFASVKDGSHAGRKPSEGQGYVQSPGRPKRQQPLIRPVLTPRFVPTCTDGLLAGIAHLSQEMARDVGSGSGVGDGRMSPVRIQSHMAEAKDQVEWVRAERGMEDIDVFDQAGLLTPHTIQAHCTYLNVDPDPTSSDVARLAQRGTAIAHCPLSNSYFSSGKPFPLREALEAGVKVGLGTDIAGGYSADIMSAMRHAVAVSRGREGAREPSQQATGAKTSLSIDWKESIYIATKGGMRGLNLLGGDFGVGSPFDAQEVCLFDPQTAQGVGSLDFFELEILKEARSATAGHDDACFDVSLDMVERWWCVGDTRNRKRVWIQGSKVLGD